MGQAAVCWDGVQQKHHNFGHAACTYKRTAAASCSGGGNPGFLYECAPAQAATPATPTTPPTPPANARFDWRSVGYGDCSGNDVGQTAGGAPLPAACDAMSLGKAAVCWSTSCTYKSTPAASCKGGASPGTLYECVVVDGSKPGPAVAPSSLDWTYVGVGDCAGGDTGSTAGSSPDPGRCGPGTTGESAVCWDGVQQKRGGSAKPVCTYKHVRAGDCRGGQNPGYLYRCGP